MNAGDQHHQPDDDHRHEHDRPVERHHPVTRLVGLRRAQDQLEDPADHDRDRPGQADDRAPRAARRSAARRRRRWRSSAMPTTKSAMSRTTSIRPPISRRGPGGRGSRLRSDRRRLSCSRSSLAPRFARVGRRTGRSTRSAAARRPTSRVEGELAVLGLGAGVGGDRPDHGPEPARSPAPAGGGSAPAQWRTSRLTSTRVSEVFACWPPGPPDRLTRYVRSRRVDGDGRRDAESIVGHDPENVVLANVDNRDPASYLAGPRWGPAATPAAATARTLTQRTQPHPRSRRDRPVSNVPGGNNVGATTPALWGDNVQDTTTRRRAPMLFLALLAIVALVVAACGEQRRQQGEARSGGGSSSGGLPTNNPGTPRAARSPTASRARRRTSACRVGAARDLRDHGRRARSTTR